MDDSQKDLTKATWSVGSHTESRAEQSRAEQSRAEQSRAEPGQDQAREVAEGGACEDNNRLDCQQSI